MADDPGIGILGFKRPGSAVRTPSGHTSRYDLLSDAMQLVERHDLRAADALQLAAALEWCGHRPQTYAFLTGDQRLQEAATLQGFDVYPV